MSSGTRKQWHPATFPVAPEAAERLREWIESGNGGLDAIGLDLRGADLSDGDFSLSWFTETRMSGVRLSGAEFYRADFQAADLTDAELTEASLVRANMDDTVLRGAILDRTDMTSASLYGVDATGASFREAKILGASLLNVNLCGADLTDAVVEANSFKVQLDKDTIVHGLSGTIFGPVLFVTGETSQAMAGTELQQWMHQRGSNVEVIPPPRPQEAH